PPPSLLSTLLPRPPTSPLFPYTTLFRSHARRHPRLLRRRPGLRRNRPVDPAPSLRTDRVAGGRPRTRHRPLWSVRALRRGGRARSEEHTSELQSRENLVCRLLLEKKKKT